MKKIIALLLAACSLLLVACNNVPTDESSVAEESVAEEPGELKYNVISQGISYNTSHEPEARYPDIFGQQLTDGQKTKDTGVHYTDVRMVGYTQTTIFNLDLGEIKEVTGIRVRSLDFNSDGVRLAGRITFYGSENGKNKWKTLGRATFEKTGNQTVSTAEIKLEEVASYQYVRVQITLAEGAFFFIDEIEVLGNVDEKVTTDFAQLAYNGSEAATNAWKAISTGVKVDAVDSENVAYRASYTFNDCVFDERAPQNDKFLTDAARTGRLFGENVWVGIKAEGKPSVTLDLEKVYNDLYAFRVYMLGGGTEINYPGAIDVYGSDDNSKFTLIGRAYAPVSSDAHAYTVIVPEYVHSRYVRFEFIECEANFWIEEIEVYRGSESEIQDQLYPEINLPVVTEDIYWNSDEPDYNKHQNLLLGLQQQICSSEYADKDDPNVSHPESLVTSPVLTDGKLATDMYCYNQNQWFYSKGGTALNFFYDIGKLSAIDTLEVSLLEQTAWGITRPQYITAYISEDGENWYIIGSYDRSKETEEFSVTEKRVTFTFKTDKPYAARFVRFRIESAALFIDELSAYGTKKVSSSTARLQNSKYQSTLYYTNPERAQYASTENTDLNASEIALIWDGDAGEDNLLLPLLAYIDEEGNIKDTFMDGILYLPNAVLPSGNKCYQANVKGDWEYMYRNAFDGKNGFNKVNEVAGSIKQELGLTDYTVRVYISILPIYESVTDFGDIDGDGITESLASEADREKVINWYINLCLNEFEKRGYEHIVFDGFYWLNEEVNWSSDDSHIIKQTGELVKAAGSNFVWIPYFTANRYFLSDEMGLDVSAMQPNVVFDLENPLYNIIHTALRTKSLKMSVEIEHSHECFSDPLYTRAYMLYLYYGAVYGYMDAVHLYYDDQDNYLQLAYSDDPVYRMQYDATYHFAKGDLDITPEKRETLEFGVAKDTVLTEGLNPEGSISLYTLVSSPENGSVSLSSDGSFRYFPNKGFTGKDSFTYTYNNYLGESEICVVEITVG